MVEPAGPPPLLQREITAKLLTYWARQAQGQLVPRHLRTLFGTFQVQSSRAYKVLCSGDSVDLAKQGIWLVGQPTSKGSPALWPVATAAAGVLPGGEFKAELRLALISDENSVMTAHGWRFDLPEADQPIMPNQRGAAVGRVSPRPMGHVQPINSWHRNGDCRCVIHPHADAAETCNARSSITMGASSPGYALPLVNETHPAFPLPARTLPGLVVAMLVSLYGANASNELIDGSRIRATAGAEIINDFGRVMGHS